MTIEEIKTRRLMLRPLTDEELRARIAEEGEAHMRQALSEMLSGCETDPAHRLWYTEWQVFRREDGQLVGSAGFKGPAAAHEAEIGYGIDEPFQSQGFATEAAQGLIDWAFEQDSELIYMTAEAEEDNAASLRVLEKLGFVRYGMGEEGPRFELERPESSMLAVYMCLGTAIGCALGTSLHKYGFYMPVGIGLGAAVGALLDKKEKERREQIAAERKAGR